MDGIFATSLSVKTSQMSSYYILEFLKEITHLLDKLALLHKPLLDCGLLRPLTEIGEVDADDLSEQSHHYLFSLGIIHYHLIHETVSLLVLPSDHRSSGSAHG